jgi:hypothetical protein
MVVENIDLKNRVYNQEELLDYFKKTFKKNYSESLLQVKEKPNIKRLYLKAIYFPTFILAFYLISLTGIMTNNIDIIFNLSLIVILFVYYLLTDLLIKSQLRKYDFTDSEKIIVKISSAHQFFHFNHHLVLLFLFFMTLNIITPLIGMWFYILGFFKMIYYTRQLEKSQRKESGLAEFSQTILPFPSRIPTVESLFGRKILVATSLLLSYFSKEDSIPITEPLIVYYKFIGKLTDKYRRNHIIFIHILIPILVTFIVNPFKPQNVTQEMFLILFFAYLLFSLIVMITGWLLNIQLKKETFKIIGLLQESIDKDLWIAFNSFCKSLYPDIRKDEKTSRKMITYYLGVFTLATYLIESLNSINHS